MRKKRKEGKRANRPLEFRRTESRDMTDRSVKTDRGNKGVELTIQSKESGREENERN